MKIFSAQQVKEWDRYTISNEPIASVDLMERAATACCSWIFDHCNLSKKFIIFCGNGNNGGDGLAIARMVNEKQMKVQVCVLETAKRSEDCAVNLSRLNHLNIKITELNTEKDLPEINDECIIIEALFGTGLNKPLEGMAAKTVQHINSSAAEVISIDIPAGLFADSVSQSSAIVKATHTLSFQVNKLSFMLSETEEYAGNIHLLNIGLHKVFYDTAPARFNTLDKKNIHSFYKPRKKFTHKYSYGHALLYAGSINMMGAAILCAKACLRSGAGLVTVKSVENNSVIQTALPEALTTTEEDFEVIAKKKSAIGIGPGLELNELNSALLKKIVLHWNNPLVIDASALHLLVNYLDNLTERQHPAILTPHTGEFEKLFGKTENSLEAAELAIKKAGKHNCYIVLKGHHTLIACPDGESYFNTTGNSGMATAGSGDVLTGIITGLLAEGYNQKESCLMGVYLHGKAGDFAAAKFSEEAMIAGDIIKQLGTAFRTFS